MNIKIKQIIVLLLVYYIHHLKRIKDKQLKEHTQLVLKFFSKQMLKLNILDPYHLLTHGFGAQDLSTVIAYRNYSNNLKAFNNSKFIQIFNLITIY
jgi:hypothetical protein